MERFQIAIVGMGQRGVNVLERISALLKHQPLDAKLTIHVIDPAMTGQGIHDFTQPDHLLINTIAAQVTVYCDKSVVGGGPIEPGLTFLEWVHKSGYRMVNGKAVITDAGDEIDENTYLSRALLGKYLAWAYERIVESMPENVTVLNHRREAVDIVKKSDRKLNVYLDGGYKIESDFVFLATGHSGCGPDAKDVECDEFVARVQSKNSHLSYLRSPYPIARLSSISPDAKVAICGAGLTAADIISALTIGVGGVFERISKDRYKYHPSGREPKMTLYTRQGLPAGGRAINQKGTYGQYKARFFTMDFIESARNQLLIKHGETQFDYDRDIWPTVKKEMMYVYSCAASGDWVEPEDFVPTAELESVIDQLITPLSEKHCANRTVYEKFVREFLAQDIESAFGGNVENPEKAAADMLRDVRDNTRFAVDYSSLTPDSHARFLSYWCSISNRLASGPPKERNMELLALIDAGIVRFFGPSPKLSFDEEHAQFTLTSTSFAEKATENFDVLIRAKVDLFTPERSNSRLVRSLLESGLAVPYKNGDFKPSGIAIDKKVNVIDRDGASVQNLWALGYIAEGAVFYTYVLPRPFANSRSLQDAGKIVISMFEQIQQHMSKVNNVKFEVA